MAAASWSLPDLAGRTYLITGSNKGLGFFSAEHLVRAGARVIMTGRNPNRLASARAALRARNPDAAPDLAETLLLDTSNLGSVRAAAASVRGRRRLDGALLNAGVVHPPATRQTTADGHEVVFATTVLGHFALAGELLTTLAPTAGRLVWVGSVSTSLWRYDPTDPHLVEGYTPWRAYVQSKVAAGAIGLEADRRLRAEHVPVASVIAHPGYSISGRTVSIPDLNEPTRLTRLVDGLQAPISQSKERGALPLVHALAGDDVESGSVWGPSLVVHGMPRAARASKVTRDRDIAARMWLAAEEATGVRWPFEKAAKAGRKSRR